MGTSVTPIPTSYSGCNFRSRAEARWAVAFTELGLRWKYEGSWFRLPTYNYLPDFDLSTLGYYAEVKGNYSQFNKVALIKARELSVVTKRPVILLSDMALRHCNFPAFVGGKKVLFRVLSKVTVEDWIRAIGCAQLFKFEAVVAQ